MQRLAKPSWGSKGEFNLDFMVYYSFVFWFVLFLKQPSSSKAEIKVVLEGLRTSASGLTHPQPEDDEPDIKSETRLSYVLHAKPDRVNRGCTSQFACTNDSSVVDFKYYDSVSFIISMI